MAGSISVQTDKAAPALQVIEDEGLKNALADAFGDESSRSILGYLEEEKAKAAKDVIRATDVSATIVYRRLHDLADLGLVRADHFEITSPGKKHALYVKTFSEANLNMRDHEFRVSLRKSSKKG